MRLRTPGLRRAALAAVAISIAASVPAAAGPADRLDDIRDRQEELEGRIGALETRSGAILDEIEVLDRRRADAEEQVDVLDTRLDRLDSRIGELEGDLEVAQRRLALLTDELRGILRELDASVDTYSERAIAIYKSGPTAYVDGLLTSDSFGELSDRADYYRAAVDSDARLIAEIEYLRDQTEERRSAVEDEEERIARAKVELERDRAALATARAERAEVLAEREAVLGAKEALLAEIEGQKSEYERIYQQLQQEEAEIESLLSSNGSTATGPLPSGGGQLLWPAAGPVTSGYGYRTHPIFGDTRLHTGIDIGAGYGAPVIASDSGRVVYAGTMSGYGNVIVVDHGGGLATTYNHLSGFSVGSGQSVSRGTTIGAVGCTGYCTGPHLHFEVRVNGSPVDPMPYLR